MSTAQLNAVAELLEANGIKSTKEIVFSVCIKTLVDAGFAADKAFDIVLGCGQFEKMADELHGKFKAA